MTLSSNSLPSEIIRDFRRALTIRDIGCVRGLDRHRHLLSQIRQDEVGASHVYDTGHLLDVDHQSYITVPTGYALLSEGRRLQMGIGLFLPHQKTSFVCRVHQPGIGWGVYVHFAQEQQDTISIYTFFHAEKFLPKKVSWRWMGGCTLKRQDKVSATGSIACSNLIYDQTDGEDVKEHTQTLVSDPLIAVMLLLRKGDVIEVEPAPWWPTDEPAKPKAFETRNPSVSVVRVNTPSIIVRPPRADDGSGATVRGSDVRAHLRRRGNKIIQVRAHPRNGGYQAAVAKVVKIDQPL